MTIGSIYILAIGRQLIEKKNKERISEFFFTLFWYFL